MNATISSTSSVIKTKLRGSGDGFEHQTVLFNCYCHSFDEVTEQLMKAIKCSSETASQLAKVAEMMGSVTVFRGDQRSCEAVADILGAIGLNVDVTD